MKRNIVVFCIVALFFGMQAHAAEAISFLLKELGEKLYSVSEGPTAQNDTYVLLVECKKNLSHVLLTEIVPEEELKRALIFAAAYGDQSIISLLLATGIDPDFSTLQGKTPLMYAVLHGNVETARALLEAGADQKRQDIEGKAVADYAHLALSNFGSDQSLKIFMIAIAKYGPIADPFLDCVEMLESYAKK